MHVPFTGGAPAGTQYGPSVALPPHHPQPKVTQTSLNAKSHRGTSSWTEQYARFVMGSITQLHSGTAVHAVSVDSRSQAVQEDRFDPCITHFPSAPHHVQIDISAHINGVDLVAQCSTHLGFAFAAVEVQ